MSVLLSLVAVVAVVVIAVIGFGFSARLRRLTAKVDLAAIFDLALLATGPKFALALASSAVAVIVTAGTLGAGEVDFDRLQRAVRGDWYDRDQQAYVAPSFEELQDHPVRKSGRLAGPSWKWQPPNWNLSWLRGLFTYLFTFILAIILLACIAMLVTHFARNARVSEQKLANRSIALDMTRAEDLPFPVEQMQGDPLTQARKLADAGRYDWAIIYLYGYFLLALDHARRIHLQKGKTNRMYLRELASRVDLRRIVEQTMIQFENAFFGKHAITAEDFERCWGELDRFHQLLQVEEPQDEAVSADIVVAEAMP